MSASTDLHPVRAYPRTRGARERGFDEAVIQIREAVQAGLPGKRKPYLKVAVLMMHWDNDDIGVVALEDALGDTFATLYNFVVEKYQIPHQPQQPNQLINPTLNLIQRTSQFSGTHAGDNHLLIYVYSGHASAGSSSFGCILYGRPGQAGNSRIDWHSIRSVVMAAPGDKLAIFDCCFAATSASGHAGECEYLAASAMELQATTNLVYCLTNRLVELLRWLNGAAITLATVHSYLVSEMHLQEHYLENTPVYIPRLEQPSILLAPITSTPPAVKELQTHNGPSARVIVSINLKGDALIPDVNQFEKYLLTHIPSNVADIKVEGGFRATSQLLLISMPVSVWTLLSENQDMAFVGHVRSRNMLLGATTQSTLVQRPKGSENIGFQPGSSSKTSG